MISDDSIPAPEPQPELAAGTPQETAGNISSEAVQTAADPALTEDLALALLQRNDLASEVIGQLSKNGGVMKSRKVKLALVRHPKAPHHVSLPLLRHLFTFDLVEVSLAPVARGDVKRAAEEVLLTRLQAISIGEKLTLAHRASTRVAGGLLLDAEPRVIHAALENSRLTEASVVKAVLRPEAPATLVHSVCYHPKWSLSREVRIALLRNENTPLARALEFVRTLPRPLVSEILHASRLPENIKSLLKKETEQGGKSNLARARSAFHG
jgi:hypothetical protein